MTQNIADQHSNSPAGQFILILKVRRPSPRSRNGNYGDHISQALVLFERRLYKFMRLHCC